MDKLEKEIRVVVAEVLELEPDKINLEAKFVEDLNMFSFAQLLSYWASEEQFCEAKSENILAKQNGFNDGLGDLSSN